MTNSTIDNNSLLFNYLYTSVSQGLPSGDFIRAVNFSKSDISAYFLIKSGTNSWLTLRTADHALWLKNAQQLQIDLGSPADLVHFKSHLRKRLSQQKAKYFSLTADEIAIMNFLLTLEQQGLICVLHLPDEIAADHKARPLNVGTALIQYFFYLGKRNNLNHLLLPIKDKKFRQIIARLYGRNFLFSQFAGHNLLKLLPTNQWITPVLSDLNKRNSNWRQNCEDILSDKTLLKQL